MTRDRQTLLHAFVALVVVLGTFTLAAHLPESGASAVKGAAPWFRVTGTVKGLYPGERLVLRTKVKNPFGFAIVVERVRAKVTSPVAACPRSAVKIEAWRGSRIVKAHGTRRVALRITMRRTAPDACQGVRFALSYTGKATRA
ncbi:MAG: hypothetical protein ACXWW5_08015 [Actinomycetota bacterium]